MPHKIVFPLQVLTTMVLETAKPTQFTLGGSPSSQVGRERQAASQRCFRTEQAPAEQELAFGYSISHHIW